MAPPVRRRANGDAKRTRILASIRELYRIHRRPTTYREIAEHAGLTMGSIGYNLPKLAQDGLIRRLPGMRGIEPVEGGEA